MKIKEDMKEKDTYELWYLGDNFDSRLKCRESLNELLKQANELIVEGRFEGLTVGGIEIAHRSGDELETVWDFNFADGKKIKQKPEVQESTQNIEGNTQRVKDYDTYWGVTGYYEDSYGNDIRCRD